MAEKNMKARIVHKHDIEANWLKATNFIPMRGEIIVYDIDENYNYERIKIGDGASNVNDLPFYAGSWNTLTDKPFGEVEGEDYIVEEGSIVIGEDMGWTETSVPMTRPFDGFVEDKTYYVIFDGEAYPVKYDPDLDALNVEAIDIEVYYGGNDEMTVCTASSDPRRGETHTFGLYETKLVTAQLDEKYIPDTIARVSDIEVHNSSETAHSDIRTSINNLNSLVGDTAVSEQISDAINNIEIPEGFSGSWSDLTDKPGVVLYDKYQYLSDYDMLRARKNINAAINKPYLTLECTKYELVDENGDNSFSGFSSGDGAFIATNEKFLAIKSYYFLSSTDGINWEYNDLYIKDPEIEEGEDVEYPEFNSPSTGIYANNTIIVMPSYGIFGISSSDGGEIYEYFAIPRLPDEISNDNRAFFWEDMAYGNNTFVAVGGNIDTGVGCITYSSDNGITWYRASSTVLENIDYIVSIAFGDGKFIAITEDGTIISSTDGINWQESSAITNYSIKPHKVFYCNNEFLITNQDASYSILKYDGDSGADSFYISSPFASKRFNSIVYRNNMYIMNDRLGNIIYKRDGETRWNTVNIGEKDYSEIMYTDNDFIILFNNNSGPLGIYHSVDGVNWACDEVKSLSQENVEVTEDVKALLNFATEEYVDNAISTIPAPDVSGQIAVHNTSEIAHNDLRTAISDVKGLVGDKLVSEQISEAIGNIEIPESIIYVGPTKPIDPNIQVWINTSEEGTGVIPVLPRITTITLPAVNWTGDTAPYSQVVEINTVTSATKIELNPTASQIVEMQNSDIALMAENSEGVVTVYSFGDKPSEDMFIQATLTEVAYV